MAPSEVNSVPHTGSLKLLGLKLPFLFFSLSLFFSLFVYLVLATLGLRCCEQAFSSCGKLGLLCSFWLLIAVASLVAELGL